MNETKDTASSAQIPSSGSLGKVPDVPTAGHSAKRVGHGRAQAGVGSAETLLSADWGSEFENVAAQSLHPHVPHPRDGQGQPVKRNTSHSPGKLTILSLFFFFFFSSVLPCSSHRL